MKKFKVLIWIISILAIFFIVANIFIKVYAPRIVERQIEQNLKLKSTLGKISLTPPMTVTLERLGIGNLAEIKKISFSPDLISLFFGKIVIHGLNIIEPVINLEQSAEGKLNLPVLEQKGKAPEIYLTGIMVENGKIIFTDKKIDPNGYQLIFEKINLRVSKVLMPLTSLAADFNLSATAANSRLEPFGDFVFKGTLDYPGRNMDAKLEVKNLNIINLAPYYGNFISNKKISSGLLNLNSDFKANNNNLVINSELNLSQLAYDKSEEAQTEQGFELTRDALDLFTDSQGNLRLEFQIETKLDNPALDAKKVQGIILKAAMKNLSNQSPEQIIEKVNTTIEKYKDIGEELKNIFGN